MKPTDISLARVCTRRRRRTPGEIAALVVEYRRSRLSQQAFATSYGIALSTFTNWLRRLKSGSVQARPAAQRLVPVKLTGALPWEPAAERIELVLRSGVVLRLPPRFDDAAVERLVEIVG